MSVRALHCACFDPLITCPNELVTCPNQFITCSNNKLQSQTNKSYIPTNRLYVPTNRLHVAAAVSAHISEQADQRLCMRTWCCSSWAHHGWVLLLVCCTVCWNSGSLAAWMCWSTMQDSHGEKLLAAAYYSIAFPHVVLYMYVSYTLSSLRLSYSFRTVSRCPLQPSQSDVLQVPCSGVWYIHCAAQMMGGSCS